MTNALIIRLKEIWHTSAQRNNWELIDDVPAFLRHVAERFEDSGQPEDAGQPRSARSTRPAAELLKLNSTL